MCVQIIICPPRRTPQDKMKHIFPPAGFCFPSGFTPLDHLSHPIPKLIKVCRAAEDWNNTFRLPPSLPFLPLLLLHLQSPCCHSFSSLLGSTSDPPPLDAAAPLLFLLLSPLCLCRFMIFVRPRNKLNFSCDPRATINRESATSKVRQPADCRGFYAFSLDDAC